MISAIESNSTAFEEGLRQGQIIQSIDGIPINNMQDFSNAISGKFQNNQSAKLIIKTNEVEAILFTDSPPNLTVSELPKSNIKTGLDLAGGSRALVKAENFELSSEEVNDLVDILENRLNVFGISDVKVRAVSDLSGNNFVLIELAGASPSDLENLISSQGKFEAKIGNKTVFTGGERDIASVSSNAQESRVYCPDQSFCNFEFVITLSPEAAERHAEITENLDLNETNPKYLNETLDLYLDSKLIDSLNIGESLKGRVTTQIMISGGESGSNIEESYEKAQEEMKRLQTVLKTGSLPHKLEIVKLDTISPQLGSRFINTILIAGASSLLAVSLIVFIRYRNFKSSIALLMTSTSEIIIILGIASVINWNLDLPSIAGILATIGTGIDQQIIILDEAKSEKSLNVKQRIKRAFTIIMGAYFTAVVALLPLLWAGAGLLKGFVVTTLIGITSGILLTRPAFADIIKSIED
jgi:preprotein translocase subunit SecD